MLCSCVYAQWPFVGSGNLNCQPMHMQGLFPRVYECPPSYWLSLPNVLRSDVPLREPSFLEHPRAAHLVASTLSLHPCDPPQPASTGGGGGVVVVGGGGSASVAAEVGSEPTALLCSVRGVPLVRARASHDEFARALAPLRRARVLHLEAPRMGVGSFADAAAADQFLRRAEPLLGSWCCSERPKVGPRGGGRRRRGGRGGAEGGSTVPALRDLTNEDHDALAGTAFKLRFRPRLGAVGDAAGGRGGRGGGGRGGGGRGRRSSPARARWEVVPLVNNVFGRAELQRDTACCKYLGMAASLEECTSAAEKRGGVTSLTWHRSGGGAWASTCYGIIDATWQPVPVEPGQAEADSARLSGGQPLGPAPELASSFVGDRRRT